VTIPTTILSSPSSLARDKREDLLERLDKALIGSGDLVPLDDARYLETHRIYEGRSDQQQLIIGWFGDQIAPTIQPDRPFRVLSVGCGSGILDVPIATRLVEQTDDLHYIGIDPNRIECEAFLQLFSDSSLDQVQVEVVPAAFEDFEATCSFDLIHIVHSLYYMPDPAGALERARELLAPGGRLVVVHAPCEALNDLTVRFWDKQYERPTLFADDFAKTLDAWSWDYERTRVDARLEVTPLAQADSNIGLALRDFNVQSDTRHLPEPVQILVERYLQLISTEHRGETHIPHPVDVFVIGA
jgi:SAM-dependent methyltransferase